MLLKSKWEINNIYESPRKHKKYRVALVNKINGNIKLIDFGDNRYQHYEDKTELKLYSNLNHYDKQRRKNFIARHKRNIKLGYYSSAYFSKKYLW